MHKSIIQQYMAAFTMLLKAVDACPERVWCDRQARHAAWHIAYHAVFYGDMYSCRSIREFVPRHDHVDGFHSLDFTASTGVTLAPEARGSLSKTEVSEYIRWMIERIEGRVLATDLGGGSGFPWLDFNRLGLHIYNIRHIQHHMAQLNERVVAAEGMAIGWIGRAG